MPSRKRDLRAGPEQLLYASVLEKGMYFSLLILIITYLIYVLGIVTPHIALHDVPRYWSMGVSDYLHQTQTRDGWGWITLVGFSDYLNFIPIAMLAGVTILCFLIIVPVLWKVNDKLYACLAFLEALILSIAASGILGAGGH